jgi:photosystem II Psb28-2 protein
LVTWSGNLWQLTSPTVQFYEGIPETISDVRLRQNTSTGDRSALLIFERMEAIEQFKSFRNEFSKALKMIDEEGVITIEPSGVKFIFGGPEGDDLVRVECILDIDRDDSLGTLHAVYAPLC